MIKEKALIKLTDSPDIGKYTIKYLTAKDTKKPQGDAKSFFAASLR